MNKFSSGLLAALAVSFGLATAAPSNATPLVSPQPLKVQTQLDVQTVNHTRKHRRAERAWRAERRAWREERRWRRHMARRHHYDDYYWRHGFRRHYHRHYQPGFTLQFNIR